MLVDSTLWGFCKGKLNTFIGKSKNLPLLPRRPFVVFFFFLTLVIFGVRGLKLDYKRIKFACSSSLGKYPMLNFRISPSRGGSTFIIPTHSPKTQLLTFWANLTPPPQNWYRYQLENHNFQKKGGPTPLIWYRYQHDFLVWQNITNLTNLIF